MKIHNSTKRALACVAALIAAPILLGFKTDSPAKTFDDVKIPVVKAANDSGTATQPFDEISDPGVKSGEATIKLEPPDVTRPNDSSATVTAEFPISKDAPAETPAAADTDGTPAEIPPPEAPPIPEPTTNATDEIIANYLEQFDGLTIVDLKFAGASDATLPTARAAVLLHTGDNFEAATAIRDRNALKALGYFYDAYHTIEVIPEGIIVTVHTLENPVLKRLDISGATVYTAAELSKMITVRRNAILNTNTLHDNLNAISEKYHADGYILMKVADVNIADDGTLTVKISEGTLEGYRVKGNTKTKDKVILREMRQKVGTPFNAKLARRSMERVYNLGFFEDVNIHMLSGVEPNAVIMEVNVKEKRTGTFGIGAGYSTREGLIGVISISDTNFRGTGDAVSLSFETSADEDDAHGFSFSYRRPWLDHHETAGTLRIYNRTYQYYDYDTDGNLKERYMRRYSGGEVTVSRPASEYSTNYVTLRQRKDSYIRHVSSGNAGDRSGALGESWRHDNFGTTRSVTLQHVTDTRDNIYNPTTGGRVSLSGEFAGFLGGDFDFQKYSIEHQQFARAGHAQVWAFKMGYGVGYGDLTEFNQFRVGGQNTLRGYRDDQFRGSHMTIGTLEYRFPLAKVVQGILFTDWGGAWSSGFLPKGKDIYGSGGAGLALNTPLGPLRLDYGRGSQGGRFHFSVGGGF